MVFQAWGAVLLLGPPQDVAGPASFEKACQPGRRAPTGDNGLSIRDSRSRVPALGSLGLVGRGDGQKKPDGSCHVSSLPAAWEQKRVHVVRSL